QPVFAIPKSSPFRKNSAIIPSVYMVDWSRADGADPPENEGGTGLPAACWPRRWRREGPENNKDVCRGSKNTVGGGRSCRSRPVLRTHPRVKSPVEILNKVRLAQ